MNRTRVEGHTNLVKDLSNGAVINTDKVAYEIAMRRRRETDETKNRIAKLEDKLNNIEQLLERLINVKS